MIVLDCISLALGLTLRYLVVYEAREAKEVYNITQAQSPVAPLIPLTIFEV